MLAGYQLLYSPNQSRLESAEAQEVTLKTEFETKQQLVANLPAYKLQMLEIQDRFDALLKQLPNQTEVPALLTDISQVGKERGLEFRRFKPLQANQKDFYVELPIEIDASGTYHQLASFVSDIANFERVVTIGNVEMQRTEFKQDADLAIENIPLTFKAILHTYHYNESDQKKNLISEALK
jgi:type IV pilus assembly protein PilO